MYSGSFEKHNLADYHTKQHPGAHHQKVRAIYICNKERSLTTLQGCIEILLGGLDGSPGQRPVRTPIPVPVLGSKYRPQIPHPSAH